MADGTRVAPGPPQVSDRKVIERELRIVVTDAMTGKHLRGELHASWRLADRNRVRGELHRRGARDELGAVVGHVTVSWRSLTDSLGEAPVIGWFAKRTRSFQERIGVPDPVSALGLDSIEIEVEIDETVFGRPISRCARAETRPAHWIVHAPAGWWVRVSIFRAGVPTPDEFREA
jgi:hypothetical protein